MPASPSIRIVSRLASVCPSASIRVFSRARTRSPRPARLPSASVISAGPTSPNSASRSRTRAASRAAVSFDVAISRDSRPARWSLTHSITASSKTRSCGPW